MKGPWQQSSPLTPLSKFFKYISIKTNNRTTLYCTIAWFHSQLYNSNYEITCHLMLLWLTEVLQLSTCVRNPILLYYVLNVTHPEPLSGLSAARVASPSPKCWTPRHLCDFNAGSQKALCGGTKLWVSDIFAPITICWVRFYVIEETCLEPSMPHVEWAGERISKLVVSGCTTDRQRKKL